MGMFDYIRCEAKLPEIPNPMELEGYDFNKHLFFTKDVSNSLSEYRISADNKLQFLNTFVPIYDRVDHTDKENATWKDCEYFTGTIDFYDSIRFFNKPELKNDYWVEFSAKVIDGEVMAIWLKAFTYQNNAKARAAHEEFHKRLDADRVFRAKWYFRFIVKPYYGAITRIFQYWRKLIDKLPPSYKVEKFLKPF